MQNCKKGDFLHTSMPKQGFKKKTKIFFCYWHRYVKYPYCTSFPWKITFPWQNWNTCKCQHVTLLHTSAAKPDPIFRVEPVFGMKKRVESGWVEPPGSKFGLDRVGLRFFDKEVLSGWTSLNPPTRANFQLQIFSYFFVVQTKEEKEKSRRL